MIVLRASVVVAAMGVTCLSVAAAQQPTPEASLGLEGCYRLVHGEWHDGPPGRLRGLPPGEFRLLPDLEPRAGSRGGIAYQVLPGRTDRTPSAFWQRVGADSVAVIWAGFPDGMGLRMRIAGDSLVGRVETWSDAIMIDADGREVRPHAEASAHRIRCGPTLQEPA